jgi:hypothetical protein
MSIHLRTQAKTADAAEKAALLDMATGYIGSSELGQRYWMVSVAVKRQKFMILPECK